MTYALTLLGSTFIAFFAHHFVEKKLTRNWTRNLRVIIRGYQIHHSTWGAVALVMSIAFTSGLLMMAILGYAIGNIWQHKYTHNRINEPGFIFLSKFK